MKKNIVYGCFIFLSVIVNITIFAQQWSEPINISNSPNVDGFPDICVDTSGVLHCVWVKVFNSSYRCVYYSKSVDQGESWSNPVKISHNNTGEVHNAMIVVDNSNIIYVIYEYDISIGNENLWFTKFNGQYWSTPVTIADGWPGLFPEEMTIDNNDRIYIFWRYFDHRIHYKYYESNVWSQDFTQFDTVTGIYYFNIKSVACDDDNNLHCIGLYSNPELYDTLRAAYYFYNYSDENWEYPVTVGENNSDDPFMDIAVYDDNPYLTWREAWGSYYTGGDGTFYKYKTGNQWSETEMIVEDPCCQQIDVLNNNVFIVDKEKEGDDDKFVFYKKNILNGWEGQIILINHFADPYSLSHDKYNLYLLLNGKIDDEDILDVYLMKTPLDSLVVTSVPKIKGLKAENIVLSQNRPNPFKRNTKIEFDLYNGGITRLIIMDIQGKIVKTFELGKTGKGKQSVIWDGNDSKGNRLPAGSYYYRLIVDDRQKTKSLILY